MKSKKNVLIILSILLLIIPLLSTFTAWPIGVYYFVHIPTYILLWIIPIIYMLSRDYKIKNYTVLLIIYIIISLWLSFVSEKHWLINEALHIEEIRDNNKIIDHKNIVEYISVNNNTLINNDSIKDALLEKGVKNIKKCYYLNYTDLWYIIGMKFESQKYIDKFWEIFIYNSSDDYVISDIEMNEIIKVTNNKCN
jgi:hypothetical protein